MRDRNKRGHLVEEQGTEAAEGAASGAVGGGMLVPLCLLVFAGPALLLGAVLLVLIGSAVVRFVIVYAPHAVAHS